MRVRVSVQFFILRRATKASLAHLNQCRFYLNPHDDLTGLRASGAKADRGVKSPEQERKFVIFAARKWASMLATASGA